jgi:GNAT superfamily N-acetyltransferase
MKPNAKPPLGAVEHYTHASLPDRVVRQRVAHHNRMLAEELPGDPPLLVEDALRRMRYRSSAARTHLWVLRHGCSIVAEANLGWAELPSNRRLAHFYVSVEPHVRRRGIGTRLLTLAVAGARRALRPRLFSHSSGRIPAGAEFLRRFGFKAGFEHHLNQLAVDRLDRALLTRWLAAGPERAADYRVELWDGPVPEPGLVAFAELQGVMNTAPHGDLEVEDVVVTPKMIREGEASLFANGSRRLIACARHAPSGRLVGFTELIWNPKRAAIVWQHNTGVVGAHRNRGLGRWLKAANMEAMLAANPAVRVVRTGNADSNAPMLAINRQMGFEPFIAGTGWQGSAPAVAGRLRRSQTRRG